VNFNELTNHLTKTFPAAHFIVVSPSHVMNEQISFYATVRCMIGISCSVFSNVLWMRPNTAILEVQTRKCMKFPAILAKMCGLWIFETTFNGIGHVNPITIGIHGMARCVQTMFEKMNWTLV
jgi:hypothetical protein